MHTLPTLSKKSDYVKKILKRFIKELIQLLHFNREMT